ncbi:MAG TPA: DUF3786 domain-containing protein [Candidatus Aquicultor sp.]
MDNYDKVLDTLLTRLAKFNFAIISSRTGAEFDVDTEALRIPFFGKQYTVTKNSCFASDGCADDTKDKILIIDYLLSFGGLDAGDGWIDFREIPSSFAYDGAFRAHVESVLEKNAGTIIRRKAELIDKYNGYNITGYVEPDFTVAFQVFPRVECLVLLYEGDEEVGAGAKVLFSSNAHNFLTTESLAAIAETLARRLVS